MVVKPDTPLTQFPGVGEVRAKKLAHLGLNTAGDLLTYYPRDYEEDVYKRQRLHRRPDQGGVLLHGYHQVHRHQTTAIGQTPGAVDLLLQACLLYTSRRCPGCR